MLLETREEMTGRQAAASDEPKDQEGLKQGRESGTCMARHTGIARHCSFSKLILNALNDIPEQRILLL